MHTEYMHSVRQSHQDLIDRYPGPKSKLERRIQAAVGVPILPPPIDFASIPDLLLVEDFVDPFAIEDIPTPRAPSPHYVPDLPETRASSPHYVPDLPETRASSPHYVPDLPETRAPSPHYVPDLPETVQVMDSDGELLVATMPASRERTIFTAGDKQKLLDIITPLIDKLESKETGTGGGIAVVMGSMSQTIANLLPQHPIHTTTCAHHKNLQPPS
ncbi:hypothetical protein CAPTEDRAFT_208387 [Capitella teleta]|uniref:Uncharacterized protein n=1 Tax=Capitella teleta TaxID=283909 RepID=R7UW58_CAPTE|nr:hypothetical protein CAPTEDRAFT_208387 [Capitella teleta]|eukprot:ELU10863.1 hypothetical protein CAPTEDRAFT_208387 [Capitella teleta]